MIYEVIVDGSNFLMADESNHVQKLGFFATRIIEAENENIAVKNAFNMIQNDSSILNKIRNLPENTPSLEVESIKIIDEERLPSLDVESINKTYMFFEDDE